MRALSQSLPRCIDSKRHPMHENHPTAAPRRQWRFETRRCASSGREVDWRKGESMRLLLATLPILATITEGFGQSLPVTSIASQPFSADEVIIENPKPNVHNVLPM